MWGGVVKHSPFLILTIWSKLLNIRHVFLIVLTKHLTLLIFSLPPTLRITPILYPLLSAPLITLFFLYPLPCLHLLLFLLPVVVYGTRTVFSGMISVFFCWTFLGRIVASVPATPVWLQVKLLTS